LVKKNRQQVAWIPTHFAKRGKIIDLKDKLDWDTKWIVTEIYGIKDLDQLNIMSQVDKDFKIVLG
jgi:hypothetical protein